MLRQEKNGKSADAANGILRKLKVAFSGILCRGTRIYQPNKEIEPIEGVHKKRKMIKNKVEKQATSIAF